MRVGRAGGARQASVSGRGAQGLGACRRAGAWARADAQARRGARSAGGQAAAREAGAGVGARGAGRERAERAAWAHWACWLVSWASFGAQCTWLSFDSVFGPVRLGIFLSHIMNTVHCKINFQKKKFY